MDRLIIEHIPGQTRAALLEDDQLVRLHIDQINAPCPLGRPGGAIYLGRVINVVPALQAAFVDIGTQTHGFLPVSQTFEDDISKSVHVGEKLLVQLRKEAHANKGASLSAKIDLERDGVILTLGRPGINVSRKISDETKRAALKELFNVDDLPEGCGLIFRTEAQTMETDTLKAHVQELCRTGWDLLKKPLQGLDVGLLMSSGSFLENLWKTYQSYDFQEVLVDHPESLSRLKQLGCPARFVPSQGTSLFEDLDIDMHIEQALSPEVPLEGGGSLSIEETRALVAIDVDMGQRRHPGGNRDAALMDLNKTALEAARKELELRGLSGQVFIDLVRPDNPNRKQDLVKLGETAFAGFDGACVHGLSRLGLLELSIARKGPSLCELMASPTTRLMGLVRHLKNHLPPKAVELTPADHQLWMSEPFATTRRWLEERLGGPLTLRSRQDIPPGTYRIIERDHDE